MEGWTMDQMLNKIKYFAYKLMTNNLYDAPFSTQEELIVNNEDFVNLSIYFPNWINIRNRICK